MNPKKKKKIFYSHMWAAVRLYRFTVLGKERNNSQRKRRCRNFFEFQCDFTTLSIFAGKKKKVALGRKKK